MRHRNSSWFSHWIIECSLSTVDALVIEERERCVVLFSTYEHKHMPIAQAQRVYRCLNTHTHTHILIVFYLKQVKSTKPINYADANDDSCHCASSYMQLCCLWSIKHHDRFANICVLKNLFGFPCSNTHTHTQNNETETKQSETKNVYIFCIVYRSNNTV